MNFDIFSLGFVQAEIESLIKLQTLDKSYFDSTQLLNKAPNELLSIDTKIKQEEQKISDAKKNISEKEKERDNLEKETTKTEDALVRLKGQQSLVKKVDEYNAINHEIEHTKQKINELEEKELLFIEEIEVLEKSLSELENESKDAKELLLKERQATENAQKQSLALVDDLKRKISAQRENCSPKFLQAYDRVKNNVSRPPYVAPLRDQICMGCHMKTSQNASDLRDHSRIHFCENCGRILFTEDNY